MVRKVIAKTRNGAVFAAALSVFCISPVIAQDLIALPSGLDVRVHEVIFEENPDIARFRFVAPGLGAEGKGYAEVQGDFPWLCQEMILPALTETQKAGDIVISLSDREIVFGQITPDATQYFELFRIADGACISEDF